MPLAGDRAHAADEDDGHRLDAAEDVGDGGGVRHDRQAVEVLALGEHARELERRGARADADRGAGHDEPGGRARDRVLLAGLQEGLLLRLGLGLLVQERQACAAVHALDDALRLEGLDVAAHGHGRDAEVVGELGDAHGALPAQQVEDAVAAVGRERDVHHACSFEQIRPQSHTKANRMS
jgi:hypothetical protein